MSRHSLDAAAAYTSLALVIAQVAVSAKDAFDALFAATSAALIARLSTGPHLHRSCTGLVVSLYNTCFMVGQVSKCRVWGGPHKAAARQALLFVPDGLLEAVENRLCLPFHGDPPSQRTYLKRFGKLERAHRHLTCHSLFANPCVAGEGVELVGLGRFGTQF